MFKVWQAMIRRCYEPDNKDYHNYGGRGIVVHDGWRKFKAFFREVGIVPRGLTIDRVDNERGYVPGNIRFATRLQQSANRRKLPPRLPPPPERP